MVKLQLKKQSTLGDLFLINLEIWEKSRNQWEPTNLNIQVVYT